MASPAAYGSSQARNGIWAEAATYVAPAATPDEKVSTIIVSISQMRKMRPRKAVRAPKITQPERSRAEALYSDGPTSKPSCVTSEPYNLCSSHWRAEFGFIKTVIERLGFEGSIYKWVMWNMLQHMPGTGFVCLFVFFQRVSAFVYSHQTCMRILVACRIAAPTCNMVRLPNFSHSSKSLMVFHVVLICISLMIKDIENFFMYNVYLTPLFIF